VAETRTSDHRGSEFQVIIYTFLGANACKFITVIKSGKKQHLTWPQWIYCDIAILQVQREQQHGVFTCLEISCSAPLCPLIFSGETSFWLWPCFVFIFFSLSLSLCLVLGFVFCSCLSSARIHIHIQPLLPLASLAIAEITHCLSIFEIDKSAHQLF